ncbi:MAG: winged helix-turn-helix domain-containing protein [Acidimicrobiales bacterium]
MASLPLAGFIVGVTADRRRHEQAELFEQAGARVVLGPAMSRATGGPVDHLARWSLPADATPARRLIAATCAARLDAVTFTSAAAVANLFTLADTMGQRDDLRSALNGHVLTATIGPETTAAAGALGIANAVEAGRPTLPALAAAISEVLEPRRHRLTAAGTSLVMQGSLVQIDGVAVDLSQRELALLDALCRRAGTVVPRSTLARDLWADKAASPHAVDVTVARLRRRLGPTGTAIRTVPRRGYWLDADQNRTA